MTEGMNIYQLFWDSLGHQVFLFGWDICFLGGAYLLLRCQVRVVRFYVSWPPPPPSRPPSSSPPPPPPPPLPSSPPPDLTCKLAIAVVLNCKREIAVVPAAMRDRSGPCRTRTASPRSEWSLPDLDHKEAVKIYEIACQKECQKICQIHMPDRMS